MYLEKMKETEFKFLAEVLREVQRLDWDGFPLTNAAGLRTMVALDDITRLAQTGWAKPSAKSVKADLLNAISRFVSNAAEADPRLALYLTTEVVEWLKDLLDSPTGSTTLLLLLAVASSEPRALPLNKAAAEIGVPSATLRRWCDNGRAIGARNKSGREWHIPQTWIDTMREGGIDDDQA